MTFDMLAVRKRLPNRRPSHTETLEVAGQVVTATVGFDPQDGSPREVFLSGAKNGTQLAAILDDASVVISVALQHGVSAEALSKSVGRLPQSPVRPADLDRDPPARLPTSSIGAALELLRSFERSEEI